MPFDVQSFVKQRTAPSGGFDVNAFLLKQGIAPKPDLESATGLADFARSQGLEDEVNDILDSGPPKLSFLQRLSKGLGAFNTAEAVLTGTEQGPVAGIKKYAQNIAQGLGSAITGRDYEGERRTFADVAEKLGIENGIAKFGIGFLGDVLLDPTTYFGGAIARGLSTGVKGATGVALRGIGKVAPEAEAGLRLAAEGIGDAFGAAFNVAHKTQAGAVDDVLTFLNKEQRARLGLAESNLNRLGSGVLTEEQQRELAMKMVAGKRAEFAQRELAAGLQESSKFFEPMQERALRLIETRERELKLLNTEINALEKKGLRLALKPTKEVPIAQKVSGIRTKTIPAKDIQVRFGKDDIPTGLIREASPERKIFSDVPMAVGSRETREFVERLVRLPKADLEGVKRLVGTREKWKGDLLDEVSQLQKEWVRFDELQQSELRLAEKVFAQRGAVARGAAQSTDPTVQKTIAAQIARGKQFAENLGLENPYETYFPFIKKDKVEKFLNETRGIRVGSEGYRKQFKNLLTNDNLELDPVKAFFTREAQIVSDRMSRDFLGGFVKKYGKGLDEFKNADEATKAGFELIKEKGIFGKELGYVPKWDARVIKNLISPEFQSVSMLAKATGFDAITNLFKRSVTGLFFPFHVRNYASGLIQNFEAVGIDALNPKNIALGQKLAYFVAMDSKIPAGTVQVAGKATKAEAVFEAFRDRFGADTFYTKDFLFALENGRELKSAEKLLSTSSLKETAKTLGLGQDAIPFRLAKIIGQFVEHQQKATAYVAALGQGKTIPEALKLAEKAGFDYGALTRFESQILRRIIPFYSFTRKNIELQLKTLTENPQRINQVLSFFENLGDTPTLEERENLPDFIKESIGVKLEDTPEGLKQFISGFGTPIEAFADLFNRNPVLKALSQANPLIKAPVEIGIGKDSFRQQDLSEVYDAREYKNAPQIIKDLLDISPVQKPVFDENRLTGKLEKVGERTQYVADPVKLLIARSLFTSRGATYLDQLFGGDIEGFAKFLKTTTGIKPQQVDVESQKFFKERDKKRELEDLLVREGKLKSFERTYIPKQ